MMDESSSHLAMHAIVTCAQDIGREQTRPCILLKPLISIDGNKWCALYG